MSKHQNGKVLVLFLCLAVSRTEQSGTIQNNSDYVRTGHLKSHPATKNTYYLCIVKNKNAKKIWKQKS